MDGIRLRKAYGATGSMGLMGLMGQNAKRGASNAKRRTMNGQPFLAAPAFSR
jgi:hypothetical protein